MRDYEIMHVCDCSKEMTAFKRKLADLHKRFVEIEKSIEEELVMERRRRWEAFKDYDYTLKKHRDSIDVQQDILNSSITEFRKRIVAIETQCRRQNNPESI